MTTLDPDKAPHARSTLLLCFLVAMIEGFDLQSAGVAAPRLAPALGLQPAQMGLFFSAATLGLIVGALAGGRIADRLGRKVGLLLALGMFGLFSISTAFAWDFQSLFAARLLTGIGLGGALPNLIAVAAEASTPRRTSSAVAAMYAGMPAGGAVASLVSVFDLHGSWQIIFLLGGAAPLVVIPLLLAFLPGGVPVRREGAADNRALAVALLFGRSRWLGTLSLWLGFFFSLLVLYLLLNWLPALLVSRGIGRGEAGVVQVAFNLAGACGSVAAGQAMDRFGRRAVVAGTFLALVAALAFLAAAPTSFAFALAAGALVGATLLAVQSILYGLAPAQYPAEVRGTGVGAAVAAGRLGSVAGPLLGGLLVTAGGSSGQVLAGIVPIAVLGGLATFVLVSRLDGSPRV